MKSKRVLISIKEDFLQMVDKVAEEEHRNRSELVREALRLYFNKRSVMPNIETENQEISLDPFSTVVLR